MALHRVSWGQVLCLVTSAFPRGRCSLGTLGLWSGENMWPQMQPVMKKEWSSPCFIHCHHVALDHCSAGHQSITDGWHGPQELTSRGPGGWKSIRPQHGLLVRPFPGLQMVPSRCVHVVESGLWCLLWAPVPPGPPHTPSPWELVNVTTGSQFRAQQLSIKIVTLFLLNFFLLSIFQS